MPKFKTYNEAQEYQLKEWVDGRPWHNPFPSMPGLGGGECCPDFSCCEPSLLAPRSLREKFAAANKKAQRQMLSMFLGGMVNKATEGSGKKVHIAGDVPTDSH